MADQNAAVNPQAVQMPGQPQYVLMPVRQGNGLGIFGFFVALIGFVIPTGLIALLGLLISLVALGKPPRGFAMMGVLIGLLGSALWLIIDIIAIIVGLLMVVGVGASMAVGFMLTQPEVVEITSDMLNTAIAVEHHHETEGEMPESLDELGLSVAALTDPWGTRYRYELVDRSDEDERDGQRRANFEITSAGPDASFGTEDDIMLSKIDRLWENAFDTFEEKMEQFGAKMETLNGNGRYRYSCSSDGSSCLGFSWCGGDKGDAPAATAESAATAEAPPSDDAPRAAAGSIAETYERQAEQSLERPAAEPSEIPDAPEAPEQPDTDTPEPETAGSGPA